MKKVKLGIIGLGQRGFTLLDTICACEECEIVAICDRYNDRMEKTAEKLKEKQLFPVCYENYKDLLADPNVQAVYVVSSWDEHVKMAIESMRANKITAMEVGGAYEIEECWELVRTYEETKTPFMFMENCCFDETELWVTSMVRNGVFGEVVHCSGAYGHDLRSEVAMGAMIGHYRLRNYTMRNCENYPTHELGPIAKILGINRGNRMVSLVSVGSKARGMEDYVEKYKDDPSRCDPKLVGRKFNQSDVVTTIITCANGETIHLRLDTTLPRVYDRAFTVHGTNAFSKNQTMCLDGEERWLGMNDQRFQKYKPGVWAQITEEDKQLGHGGMDGIEFRVFINCIRKGIEPPIDVYDAASWMCISCLSEASIAQGGKPQEIPDFTHGEWLRRPLQDVIELPVINKEWTGYCEP